MTDRAALLAAVLAAPDDDAPRLIYADWLTENGQPERGELIRVQRELARLGDNWIDFAVGPHAADYPEFEDERDWLAVTDRLAGRERELLQRHDNEWKIWCPYTARGGIDGREIECHHSPAGQVFRRGFVETVEMDADGWLLVGDAILAAHPATEVRLTTWPGGGQINLRYGDPDGPDAVFEVGGRELRVEWGGGMDSLLRARWPAVKEWGLPPPPADYPELNSPEHRDDLRTLRAGMPAPARPPES
jgi:uncharacterized protein (TIGR02996 family)